MKEDFAGSPVKFAALHVKDAFNLRGKGSDLWNLKN
jgi:hypothetical protein